jgi:mercuric ion transport protein
MTPATPDTGKPAGYQSMARSSGWSTIAVVAAAVAACAVCCAGPLLVVLGGLGAVFTVGAIWVPILAVVAAAAFTVALVLWQARRRSRRRRGSATIQLGMPNSVPAIPAAASPQTQDTVGSLTQT